MNETENSDEITLVPKPVSGVKEEKGEIEEKIDKPPAISVTKQPVREVDTISAERREARRLPKPPGKNLTFNQLLDWTKLLTSEMWSHVTIYVYRLKPIIIRKLADPTAYNYIDKLTEVFDEEYMITRHGGGDYSFEINDNDLPMRQNVASAKLSISMSQHWPKLNYLELDLQAKGNIGYISSLKGQGILNNEGKPMTPNGNSNSSSTGLDVGVIKEVLGFVSKMTSDQQTQLKEKMSMGGEKSGVVELLLEKMKQDDPNKQMTMLLTLLTAFKEMVPKADNSSVTMLDKVMAIQQNSFITMLEMMKTNQAVQANSANIVATDPFALFDKMIGMKQKLDELGGNGSSQGKVSWQDRAIDAVERVGVPLVQTFAQLWALNKQAMGSTPQAHQTPQSPKNNVTTMTPRTANPFNNPEFLTPPMLAESMGVESNTTPPNAGIPNSPSNEVITLVKEYGGLISGAITGGTPGWEFGYDVSRLAGIIPHNRIREIGVDNVIATAKQIPEFWNQVSLVGEPVVKKWLEDFIDFENQAKLHENDEE